MLAVEIILRTLENAHRLKGRVRPLAKVALLPKSDG